MPEYLSPGVYVEEVDTGSVPMAGVSTSTAGFIGMANRGPVTGRPELVTSFADYQRTYGGYLSEAKYGGNRFLPYAVEQFFLNGGSRAFITRVVAQDAKPSKSELAGGLRFTAANAGLWGDGIRIRISPSSKAKTQALSAIDDKSFKVKSSDGFAAGDIVSLTDGKTTVYQTVKSAMDNILVLKEPAGIDMVDTGLLPTKVIRTCEMDVQVKYGDLEERYGSVSLNASASSYIVSRMQRSALVQVSPERERQEGKPSKKDDKGEAAVAVSSGLKPPYEAIGGTGNAMQIALSGGSDGSIASIAASDYMGADDGPGKRTGIRAYMECPDVNIMAVPGITIPEVQLALVAHCENAKNCFAVLDIPLEKQKVADVLEHRDMFDSTYAALYHPWLECFDPLARRSTYMPPSGAVLGIYARSDSERGVHKAPANEVVRGVTSLSCPYNEGEQDMLNPKGVNLIRSFTGRGIRVWGARTVSSNPLWRYINVRRLFIYVEESIRRSTDWVVFEPNSEMLWGRVKRSIELFLSSLWSSGALAGASPAEAFFVDIGPTTMTQDDIDSGRLICMIGIAPVKPAEFVIFRVTQHTLEAGDDEGGEEEGGEEGGEE